MPRLEWIGKAQVVNHAREVPFHVLERKYSYGDNSSNNKIIHGDNLLALKSLLPEYEGRVKCIYIDPPYNTGNEGWVYNDNVNDPRIKKWLGEVVGKEGEDLSRHDKWLCMMYPRLRLLQKLLSSDGAIFISIDDNEEANLKLICNEIFGSGNFVANISWQRTYSTRNDSKGIVVEAEHILVYSKTVGWQPGKLPRTAEMDKKYKNPDSDYGLWRSDNPYAPGAATHQGMVYAIQHPFTGKMLYPTNGRCWTFAQDDVLKIMNGWCPYELKDLHDDAKRASICGVPKQEVRQGVQGIVLSQSLQESKAQAEKVLKKGPWPRFYFSKNGQGGIARKTYLDKVGDKPPTNNWPFSEVGHTDEAKKEGMAIFGGKLSFDTPKPTRLIERILQIATDKDSIILDSFAGSGTTAHAVLNLNKKDGGNRKFILIEMMDYADTITAERVKRVISGYGEGKNAVEGTGGGFDFYKIGVPLMENGLLNESVPPAVIRRYVWYMEIHDAHGCASVDVPKDGHTTTEPPEKGMGECDFLGIANGTAYYFCYKPREVTVLDEEYLATITVKADSYVIYADRCLLSDEFMERHHIVFKKIPRDIAIL